MSTEIINNSQEIVKTKISLALTKAETGIQKLATMESSLVYNEDNLDKIKSFLYSVKIAKKVIEDERVILKEPFLQSGRNVDNAAKELSSTLLELETNAHGKYTTLCHSQEKRRKEQELEKQRKKSIKEGIDKNLLEFSSLIAAYTTTDELLAIESKLNLEKARKPKYAEFYDEFIERAKELNALITKQKGIIKEIETIKEDKEKAELEGDDRKSIALEEKQGQIEAKFEENKVLVQETSINQALSPKTAPETATEVFAPIKSRKTWKYKISDEKKAYNKGLLTVEINSEKAKAAFEILKSEGLLGNKEEYELNGITYFIETKFN